MFKQCPRCYSRCEERNKMIVKLIMTGLLTFVVVLMLARFMLSLLHDEAN